MSIPSPRRSFLIASVIAVSGLSATAASSATERSSTATDRRTAIAPLVERAVAPLLAEHGAPGVAVAVTVDGQAMFFNFGLASKADKTPVNQHTLFEIGSVSKPFTATLALYAQATGKLALDQHPGAYLPQLKGTPLDAATLLHLGTYTAGGLPQQVPDEVTDNAGLMAYLRSWKPSALPGAERRYSNPSIGLLGQATAVALRSDFGTALERLLPQLGVQESFVRVPAASMARYAWGYDGSGQPIRAGRDVLDAQAYGVKASAADLIRFVQRNLDPAQSSGPVRRAIDGTHLGYFQVGEMVQGLGWEQYRGPVTLARLLAGNSSKISSEPNRAVALAPSEAAAPAGTWFNKTGATRGFSAYAAFVPSQRIGIVILANKFCPAPARIAAAHAIVTELAGRDSSALAVSAQAAGSP